MNRHTVLLLLGSVVACAVFLPTALSACLDLQQPMGGDAKLNLICGAPDKPGRVDLEFKTYNSRNQPIGRATVTVSIREGDDDVDKAAAISQALNNELPGSDMAGQVSVMAAQGTVIMRATSPEVAKIKLRSKHDGTGEDMDTVSKEASSPEPASTGDGLAASSRYGVTIRFYGTAAGHRWQSSSRSYLYVRFAPYRQTMVDVRAGDTPEVLAARVAGALRSLGLESRAVGSAVEVTDRWGRDITQSYGIGLHDADMSIGWEAWE